MIENAPRNVLRFAIDVGGTDDVLLLAKGLKDASLSRWQTPSLGEPLAEAKGEALEGLRFRHPFVERDSPVVLGHYVTVGHGAIVHACKLGDEVLVGMGAIVLDGVVVGRQSLIGAKALVTQGMKIPPGSLVLGAPARVVRKLSPKERAGLKWWAQKYVDNGAYCLKHGINVGAPLPS